MTTLVHDAGENRASALMLKVQAATDFPLHIKIGRDTFKLADAREARKFSLGMLAVLEAHEIEFASDMA
jgi:hypothetical protein